VAVKPSWQRARVVKGDPDMLGKLFWVECREAEMVRAENVRPDAPQGAETKIEPSLRSNIIDPIIKGSRMFVACEDIELLADFAKDVPLVKWEDFLAECRKES
jgi:hypothetical protein